MFTAGAATSVTQSVSPWWFVLPPIAAVIVSVAGVWLVVRKDQRVQDQTKAQREERLDHAADAVLGSEPDWKRGRPKIVGLLEKVDDQKATLERLAATVGHVNGHGKSVMDHIAQINETLARIGGGQSDAAHQLEQHQAEDAREFAQINKNLNRVRDTVTQLAERREQP